MWFSEGCDLIKNVTKLKMGLVKNVSKLLT